MSPTLILLTLLFALTIPDLCLTGLIKPRLLKSVVLAQIERCLGSFKVRCTDIKSGKELAKEFIPLGAGKNPVLTWADPPDGTESLAVAITDESSQGFFAHFLLKDIPAGVLSLPLNCNKKCLGVAVTNSYGVRHYKGPEAPEGIHTYHLIVYAMKGTSIPAEKYADFRTQVKKRTISEAEINATFKHVPEKNNL